MDFFQHQDDARRRTGWLVALFAVAVLVIIALVYAVVAVFVTWVQLRNGAVTGQPSVVLWDPRILLGVGVGVIVVVASGSFYKIAQLAGGGQIVASSLGGRPVSVDSTDPGERKLLNVVEEMAIASGTPVPPVYVMDRESGINAFAAGYSPTNAVIGVTRGAIDQLSRDELQGVIAHEFSHILSGDMRINVRLIGVIHGILVIGLIGYGVMRAAGYGAVAHRRSSRDSNPLPLLLLGLALVVIGFAGTFFGRLIKAAVSRQREFLADAAAVQFTRQPEGLAGALKKIGGYTFGSRLHAANAEQASHMLFGQGLRLTSLFATHPPLPERIQRIQPDWDGQFIEVQPTQQVEQKIARKHAQLQGQPGAPSASLADRIAAVRASAVEQIGAPAPQHLAFAAALIDQIPAPVGKAVHESYGSRAVIYALLLDEDAAVRDHQLQRLREAADQPVYELVQRLHRHVASLPPQARLPLVDMALPALRQLSPDQYEQFRKNVDALVRADQRIDLFEWTLSRVLLRHLATNFGNDTPPRIRYRSLKPLADPLATVLSTLAYVGHSDGEQVQHAFDEGLKQTGMVGLRLKPKQACRLGSLDDALEKFAKASPGVKKKLLTACATCIETDATVTPRESDLLRAIADTLDCPMPPVLPGQSLSGRDNEDG